MTLALALAAAERGLMPDGLIRIGIRSLLRGRLRAERRRAGGGSARTVWFVTHYLLRRGKTNRSAASFPAARST